MLFVVGGYGTTGRPTSALDGRLHVVGGLRDTGGTGEHDVYDPGTDRWSRAAPIPTARDQATGAVLGGRLYVAGGRPGDLTALEVYDPGADRWSAGAALSQGRSALAGTALRGAFVVLGGEDAQERQAFTSVDAYDPVAGRWMSLPALPVGRQGVAAAVVAGRLLLSGGAPSAGGREQAATLLILG